MATFNYQAKTATVAIALGLMLSSCAKLWKTNPKITPAPNKQIAEKPTKFQRVAANKESWPNSWKEHHHRFTAYVKMRSESWPTTEINFHEPHEIRWELITGGNLPPGRSTPSIEYFRNGKHYLTRNDNGSSTFIAAFYPGTYTASVPHFIKSHQHLSRPFHFRVRHEKGDSDGDPDIIFAPFNGGSVSKITPFKPESEEDIFPNQWWYHHIDFHLWSTRNIAADEFFETVRPFQPSILIKEIEGPAAKRNLLDPKLEALLELRTYHDGKLTKTEPAAGKGKLNFDEGPGHYLFLIVAPDDSGDALIVARPFQAWFPDEGDGILRLIPLDTDQDGIPDYWEKWHNLDPENPDDAATYFYKKEKVSFLKVYKNREKFNYIR